VLCLQHYYEDDGKETLTKEVLAERVAESMLVRLLDKTSLSEKFRAAAEKAKAQLEARDTMMA
jgi:hypothetical protein